MKTQDNDSTLQKQGYIKVYRGQKYLLKERGDFRAIVLHSAVIAKKQENTPMNLDFSDGKDGFLPFMWIHPNDYAENRQASRTAVSAQQFKPPVIEVEEEVVETVTEEMVEVIKSEKAVVDPHAGDVEIQLVGLDIKEIRIRAKDVFGVRIPGNISKPNTAIDFVKKNLG